MLLVQGAQGDPQGQGCPWLSPGKVPLPVPAHAGKEQTMNGTFMAFMGQGL